MGMWNDLRALFKREEPETPHRMLDMNADGEPMYTEDVIAKVKDELDRRKNERLPLERQWMLNSNFLVGNQYCDINFRLGEIEQLQPVYDWLERETFNKIAPLTETRIANLRKISYAMHVKPRTNELEDYAKAEISSAILRYKQSDSDFETKKNTLIAWNELCGNCFVLSWWDKNKGEEVHRETVIAEDGEGGVAERSIAYYEGDVDYGLLTPYEVYPESVFKQGIENQRSIIVEQVKSVEDIEDLYGIRIKGTSVTTFELTPVPSGGGYGYENTVMSVGSRTVDNCEKVITYFEKPGANLPGGRMIIVVGDKHLVYYGDLPYKRIPLVQTVCREVAGQFFGKSVIEDLIPLQRAHNGCVNRIHEYIKRIAIQGHYVEEGSVDIDEYNENGLAPGAALVYRQGSNPPTPIPNGVLPSEMMAERYNLMRDMEYVAGVSQLTASGAVPAGVTSGVAIESIKATDDTRLSLTGDHIRNCVRNLAKMWLEIYKEYAEMPRVVQSAGINAIGNSLIWKNDSINSYDIEFIAENELLFGEDAQRQRFFEAFNLGLFTDEQGRIPERVKHKAIEMMKIGNYSEILNINTLHLQAAQRENSFLEENIIPEISEFDDHQIHYEEHMRYILQMHFKYLKKTKPYLAEVMEKHALQHKEKINGVAQMQQQMMLQQMMMNQGGEQNEQTN